LRPDEIAMARGLVAAHDGTLGVAGIRKKDEEN
ncbi:MAG: hypothetical protein, partial [Olavius algarvensis Gamma 1 endosymbiont]